MLDDETFIHEFLFVGWSRILGEFGFIFLFLAVFGFVLCSGLSVSFFSFFIYLVVFFELLFAGLCFGFRFVFLADVPSKYRRDSISCTNYLRQVLRQNLGRSSITGAESAQNLSSLNLNYSANWSFVVFDKSGEARCAIRLAKNYQDRLDDQRLLKVAQQMAQVSNLRRTSGHYFNFRSGSNIFGSFQDYYIFDLKK